jgi:hypothetical protein
MGIATKSRRRGLSAITLRSRAHMLSTTQRAAIRSASRLLMDVFRLEGGALLYAPIIAD